MKSAFYLFFSIVLSLGAHAQSAGEWYRKAQSAYEAEDFDLAIQCVDQAISISRKGDYFKLRGDAFHKQEEFGSALADYDFASKMGCLSTDL
ncbi:MAG: hypothetical protein HKN32_08990, partial [Flavobacteriales bacterium]|nr:hypothetical protein [Flavobacteriales bacterium]